MNYNLILVVFILLRPALYPSVISTENKVRLGGSERMVSVTKKTQYWEWWRNVHSEEFFDATVGDLQISEVCNESQEWKYLVKNLDDREKGYYILDCN